MANTPYAQRGANMETEIWQIIRTVSVAGMRFTEAKAESESQEAMLGQCEAWSSANKDLNISYKVALKNY